jgi:histidinol-phosphatase (PHP family)
MAAMKLPPDYHMHTPLCRHAVGRPTDYAAHAVVVGLTEIGFSDHSPMPEDGFDDWRMVLAELDSYVESVNEARRAAPALSIRLALEVDYLPGGEDWIRDLAGRHPWDYLIGSVHYLDGGWDIDNPHKVSRWQEQDPLPVWTAYFERLAQAAESRLFDSIGHPDLCKKFGFRPRADCRALYRAFLSAAQRSGVAIELNTAGLRKQCREIYPSREFLQLACEMGVPITFGSDAHSPVEVGMNFPEAVALARSVGYREGCRFSGRQRSLVPL